MKRIALAALALTAASAGCVKAATTPPGPGAIELPSFHGCGPDQAPSGGDVVLPIKVVRPGAGNALPAAGVCVDGRGPFTFVVDTGAEATAIDSRLASQLRLPAFDRHSLDSFGCSRSVAFSRVASLSVAGLDLPPQTVVIGPIRSPALPNLMGVLGSDVLQRFGAVRFNFDQGTLTLGRAGSGPPDDAIRAGTVRSLPATTTAETASIPGEPGQSLPIAEMTAQVSVAGRTRNFVIDTGAVRTFVSPALSAAAALQPSGPGFQGYTGYDCPVRTSQVGVRSWSIRGFPLTPTSVYSNVLPAGVDGLLGSGTLTAYNPVVVDYRDSALMLGPSTAP